MLQVSTKTFGPLGASQSLKAAQLKTTSNQKVTAGMSPGDTVLTPNTVLTESQFQLGSCHLH